MLYADPLRHLSAELASAMQEFWPNYLRLGQAHGFDAEHMHALGRQFVLLLQEQLKAPFQFEALHRARRAPFDYLKFGVEFFRPVVLLAHSILRGDWDEVADHVQRGDNVVLLANHQTEADPQALHLLLEPHYAELVEGMTFMAGERVLKDPLAAPFSMGRNLVCVYSRRHLDHPPELRARKLEHNQNAVSALRGALRQGGMLLYVAPSGGRDRPNATGQLEAAPFDPDSVELLRLLGERSSGCHFYPLALATYNMLPPPDQIRSELGEARRTLGGPIGVALGSRLVWETTERGTTYREQRATQAHRVVAQMARTLWDELEMQSMPSLSRALQPSMGS